MSKTKAKVAAKKLVRGLERTFQRRRAVSIATITSVSRDNSGRVVGATGTVEGLSNVSIRVDYNAPIRRGSQVVVENWGTAAKPDWRQVSDAGGIIGPAPLYGGFPGDVPLVTPSGLNLGPANLLFNSDFSLQHRGHRNQPVGWVSKGMTQLVGEMGDE